jgi:hypothetical protein
VGQKPIIVISDLPQNRSTPANLVTKWSMLVGGINGRTPD